MKFRRIICTLLSAALLLTTLLACGITAGAASSGLAVTSTLKDGTWTVQLYGMTKQQYTTFVNGKKGFRANINSADGLSSIFIAPDFTKNSEKAAIPGYKGGKKVYAGLYGRGLTSYSTWASTISCDGLYGTAPGKTYGFEWKLDDSDSEIHEFLPSIFCSPDISVTFEDVYRAPLKISGIGTKAEVTAQWGEAPLTYSTDKTTAYVTIPAVNMSRYTGRKNAVLDLSLTVGKYSVNVKFSGGSSGFTYNASAGGADVTKSVKLGGSFDKYGAAILTADMGVEAPDSISAVFRITENGKLTCGSNTAVTLKAPEPPKDISKLKFSKIPDAQCTGKALEPELTIKDGKKTLVYMKDYITSCRNNVLVGTATVTITGRGNYTGTKTMTFKVVPQKVKLTGKTSGTKENLSWSKSAGAEGYEVHRSVNGGKFGKLSTDALKYTAKLEKGKSYQFKIRPYATVNGKKVYGPWSNVVSVK